MDIFCRMDLLNFSLLSMAVLFSFAFSFSRVSENKLLDEHDADSVMEFFRRSRTIIFIDMQFTFFSLFFAKLNQRFL